MPFEKGTISLEGYLYSVHFLEKNDVISSVRKHHCALGWSYGLG